MPEDSSLNVILEEARRVLDVQSRFLEALDTRAGLVLGFAGTLVALATGRDLMTLLGRALAATAALFALLEFVPQWFPATNLRRLRAKHIGADPMVARSALVSAYTQFSELADLEIETKQRRPRIGATLLLAALFFVAAGGART